MTRRLILALTAAVVVFWVVAAGIGMLAMNDEFDEVFDSALQETAQRLVPLIVDDLYQRDAASTPRMLDRTAVADHEEYLTYQVRDSSGRVLMHSHDAPSTPFDAPLASGFWNSGNLRIYTESAISDTLFVQVADPLDHRREAVMEGGLSLLIPLVALVPGSILVIWLVVRLSLRPIAGLRAEIGERGGGNMSPLEVAALPPELETIALSVNRLLERLRAALESERDFTSNSAHELRTPIAGALAQTQRLIAELPTGALVDRARMIETALSDLARLAEKLLQLARAEAGIGAAACDVDLVEIAGMVVADFRGRPGTDGRLRFENRKGGQFLQSIDPDAFAIALRNLIENALIHGDEREPVEVAVAAEGVFEVTNGGPAIPADRMADLAKRFRRGATEAPGSGLGLAIAERLVVQMGGRLELLSPVPGRGDGFRARMQLPKGPVPA